MALEDLLAVVQPLDRRKKRSRGRWTSTGFHGTSRSSWTATAAGQASGTCRASRGIAPASNRCATSSKAPPGWVSAVLTLYAFSVENWKRPPTEVSTLMMLLKRYLRLELNTLLRNNIRFKVIGRFEELSPDVQSELKRGRRQHRSQQRHAVQHRAELRRSRGDHRGGPPHAGRGRRPDALDEARFGGFLYTAGQPDPDLLIRTSGEMRVSNFLLWQIAYAEIWVTETLWPDFRARHLLEAILEYQKRDRRYGGITQPVVAGR